MTIKILTGISFFLLISINCYTQNTKTVDSLNNKLKTALNEIEKADIYTELCWNYRDNQPVLAFEYGTKALKIYILQNNISKQCNVLNKLGIAKRNSGEFSAALDYFFQVIPPSRHAHRPHPAAEPALRRADGGRHRPAVPPALQAPGRGLRGERDGDLAA